MKYLVKGSWPRYTITGWTTDNEMISIDHAADMRQVMNRFVHKLNPGDSIEWVDDQQAAVTSVAAWWAEQDGAMPT